MLQRIEHLRCDEENSEICHFGALRWGDNGMENAARTIRAAVNADVGPKREAD